MTSDDRSEPALAVVKGHRVRVSVVVPVYNDQDALRACLDALARQTASDYEIIVVDDASRDAVGAPTAGFDVRLFRHERNSGAGAARNTGAQQARGEILLFIDADVVVPPDLVARVEDAFASNPDMDALFGSYDAEPTEPTLVSRFRNLLHHWVHQTADRDASTFWTGCGAIRRSVFERAGGFDVRKWTMEDVDLGYRIKDTGSQIVLDRTLQVKHLKRWTLRSMIRTDLIMRAIPWTMMLFSRPDAPSDLNIKSSQRASVALSGLVLVSALLSLLDARALLVAAASLAAMVYLNRDFYAFLRRAYGVAFALACIPLHLVYFITSGIGYVCGWVRCKVLRNAPPRFTITEHGMRATAERVREMPRASRKVQTR